MTHPHDDSPAFASDAPAPVRDLARACMAFVHKSVGVALDGTPDTLPLLDHYLTEAAAGRGEIHALVAAAAGAYFGEVIRGQYPCRWVLGPATDDPDHDAWRLEFEKVFLYLHPVAIAREALARDDGHDDSRGSAGFTVRDQDRPALAATLDVLGSVDEAEYYLLSTRFDVLSAVADRLAARRQAELSIEDLPTISAETYSRSILIDPKAN